MLKKGQFETIEPDDALYLRDGRVGQVTSEVRHYPDGTAYVLCTFTTFQAVIAEDVKRIEVDGYDPKEIALAQRQRDKADREGYRLDAKGNRI